MKQRPPLLKGFFLYMAAALWNLGLIAVGVSYSGVRATLFTWPGAYETLIFVAIAGSLGMSIESRISHQKITLGMGMIAVALTLIEVQSVLEGRELSIEVLSILFLASGALLDWRAFRKIPR